MNTRNDFNLRLIFSVDMGEGDWWFSVTEWLWNWMANSARSSWRHDCKTIKHLQGRFLKKYLASMYDMVRKTECIEKISFKYRLCIWLKVATTHWRDQTCCVWIRDKVKPALSNCHWAVKVSQKHKIQWDTCPQRQDEQVTQYPHCGVLGV